ncbi:metal ABC transporter solute-binding protein, Zn/Mn family [Bifidobacterium mongoliense]|uniref:metal ABC transporter solute-binding protein, Zn/Mn family n=1 Tax=Bifidobacterium mongoliense TaxID=518643 RepID=UPI002649E455|nr:zinc ABC transporter substrate-binding protein [Bifidobacterium mongoliense]MDN6025627.1 zinc ABC transporter substrate-binding protein [Bifidobacterium mongoliense]MDN6050744.1 zinc ABC transporter substrate-binding protein [Bifidobacterium mongoliense]MDN6719527.1 zinc ABC transporter substrate-binding protein [Bifidobacterium mongoliense]MDN6768249.1 zinc ABC transporter substrate-binding protein [Bifidobacterium mongoliense]MDN6782450.1 zinc ABC transporter substrate-binding protein [Bi
MVRHYRKALRRLIAAATAAGTLVSLSACQSPSSRPSPTASPTTDSGPILVASSLKQWGALAQTIGGSDVSVTSVFDGASSQARNFEPSTHDVDALRKATVVVSNGAGYDPWAAANLSKGAQSVSAAEAVGALDGDNPYLWFSKDARGSVASELTEVFSKLRPAKKRQFTARLGAWRADEAALATRMKKAAAKRTGSTYASDGTVGYYLMSDMGFKDLTPRGYAQATLAGGSSGSADLEDFQHLLQHHQVTLFVTSADAAAGTDPAATDGAGSEQGDTHTDAADQSHSGDDASKTLLTAASQGGVPVFRLSAAMPPRFTDLTAWMSDIVSGIGTTLPTDKAAGDQGNDGRQGDPSPSPTEATPHSTATSRTP